MFRGKDINVMMVTQIYVIKKLRTINYIFFCNSWFLIEIFIERDAINALIAITTRDGRMGKSHQNSFQY